MDINPHSVTGLLGMNWTMSGQKFKSLKRFFVLFCFVSNGIRHNGRLASVVVAGWLCGLLACYITEDFLLLVNVKIKLRSVLNS